MITDTAVSARVDDALAAVRAEVARTDTKASLLLALTETLLAGVAAGADIALPTPARLAGSVAGLLLVAAVLRLLLVVRPCLPKDGGDRASFPYWSRCTTSQLAASLEEDRRLHQIAVLSGIAMRKHRGVRRAVDRIIAALALLVPTAGAAVWG